MQRPEPAPSARIVGPRLRSPRWIAAACGAVLALLLFELIGRIEGAPICAASEGHLLAADDEVGWTYTPDLTFTFDPCVPPLARRQWSAPVSINAHGLHDQRWSYAKPKGEVRVLVLGDEAADGIGIARADRLSVRLAHLTDRRRGARVAAINATIAGYDAAQSLRFLEKRGLRYQPDVVVLLLDPERDLAAALDPPEAQALAADIPPASGMLAVSGALRWLARQPNVTPARALRVDEPSALANDATRAQALAALRATTERIATVSRDAGAGLLIVIAPRCPLPPAPPRSLCEDLTGIAPCVDLAPVFADLAASKPDGGEMCLPGQARWGRDAHFIASHKIWDTLGASSLWPPTVVRGHRL